MSVHHGAATIERGACCTDIRHTDLGCQRAEKLASEPLLCPLTTEVRVTDVRAERAALDRGRPVVLIIPPAVEQADAVWELVSPAIPALVVCLEHTIAAEWAARAPASLRVHAVTSLGRSVPLLKESPVDVLAGTAED